MVVSLIWNNFLKGKMRPSENAEKNGRVKLASRGVAPWFLMSAFWLLLAVASAVEMWLLRPDDLAGDLRFAATQWLPWVFLTPLLMWLSAAFTLEGNKWRRTIWVHLAACVTIVGALGFFGYCAGPVLTPATAGSLTPNPARTGVVVVVRRATMQLPIFWAVIGAAHALLFYQRDRDRERREAELRGCLTQARLAALRMQLNPHFLFNTLNSITSLVREDPPAAEEMIQSLSALLRLTLTAGDRQEISLREELQFLDRYLGIEQTRFGDRFRVEKQIETDALDALTPSLILQPLVENAIKHGIQKQIMPGFVRIQADRCGDALRLQVTNSGPPLDGKTGQWREGVGLGNTRTRLRELYDGGGSLNFWPRPEGGLMVELRIPWRAAPLPRPAVRRPHSEVAA